METVTSVSSASSRRIDSIDILRGVVMIVMALDHTRDFFHHEAALYDPTDLSKTSIILFLTRWITHFCAPVFVFLAGTSVSLALARGKSKKEMSWFLISRGIWLIILEITVVRFAWAFNFDYAHFTVLQVIWVIGLSMIVLAGLIHFSLRTNIVFAVLVIVLHNALDAVQPAPESMMGYLWIPLHVQGLWEVVSGFRVFVIYPFIPWFAVMAAGYALGSLYQQPKEVRRKFLLQLGGSMIALFVLLRGINIYGDLHPWQEQSTWPFTILSFLNTTKYPPSLDYLLMTLGPSILLLALIEEWNTSLSRFIVLYGRVPMFYYVIHIYLIHFLAGVFSFGQYGTGAFTLNPLALPPDFGFRLWVVYVVWIGAVSALYPLCRWYASVKKNSKNPIFSYL